MSDTEETHAPTGRDMEDLDEAALTYRTLVAAAPEAERIRLRDDLVHRSLPFAGRLARRYWGRGVPYEDLEQVARLGLVKAIDRYDPERGSFTAYAVITITGEIKRHFRDKSWGVRVPRRLQELGLSIGQATVVLTQRLSRSPTVVELAEYLETTEESIVEAMEGTAGYSLASLNAPVGGEAQAELGDLFGAPDAELESVDDRLAVTSLLCRLPARERQILAMRFYGNRTQADIAAELGISQMHVSRLITRSLTWLREAMLSDMLPPWHHGEPAVEHPELRVSVLRTVPTVLVVVQGEVDRDGVPRLRAGLTEAAGVRGAVEVQLDLSAVPLIDAAGVAALVAGRQGAAAAGMRLRLVGVQPYVARILAVSGLAALVQ